MVAMTSVPQQASSFEGRILVLTQQMRDARRYCDAFAEAGLSASCCGDFEQVGREMERGAGVLVLAEEVLETGRLQRLVECGGRRMGLQLAILVLTAGGPESPATRWSHRLAEMILIQQPVQTAALVAAARFALQARARQIELWNAEEKHRRTEEALNRSEERLRGTFENAAVGILEADSQDHLIGANERACKILGYSRAGLVGMSVHELTYPEDRPLSDELNGQLHQGRCERLEYEKRYLRGDGRPLWVHVTVVPIRSPAGEYVRSIGTIEDIGERRAAEEALRASEEQFRAFFDNAAVGAVLTDPERRLVRVNDRYCQIMGCSREELLGRSPLEMVHPEERDQDGEHFLRLLEGRLGYDVERRCVRQDGKVIWVHVTAAVIRDAGGIAVGVASVVEDITARKQAEAGLRESEQRFRTLADNMAQLAWMADEKGAKFWFNKRWFEYTGTSLPEMEDVGWQKVHHPDHVQRVTDKLTHCFQTGEVWEDTFPLRGKEGQYRWFLSQAIPIRDAQGKVLRWFGTNTDVTEQREAEQALREAKAAAEQANQAKDQFLAVLSHELRTPLTPVLAAASMLQAAGPLSEELREGLEVIRRNAELEARLIDDLLDVTRIARGKVELRKKPVRLAEVIRQAVEVCKPDIEARRLEFGVDLGPAESGWVEADIARLQQVFWNLLKNAIKFTPAGGCVGVRCRIENGEGDKETRGQGEDGHAPMVTVEVNDSGAGIEPEALGRIFNAFEQADRSITRQFGGLGLGLAISKALVEMHGGTMEAHSEGPGKGASFRVKLPVISCQLPVTSSQFPAGEPQGPLLETGNWKQGTCPVRILLVEDHGDSARVLSRILRTYGHEVQAAGDVGTALDLAGRERFELLISDLGLPDGSGVDLLHELRRRGYGFPAIALSGYGQEEDLARSKAAGFAEHLIKPVDFGHLRQVVQKYADKNA